MKEAINSIYIIQNTGKKRIEAEICQIGCETESLEFSMTICGTHDREAWPGGGGMRKTKKKKGKSAQNGCLGTLHKHLNHQQGSELMKPYRHVFFLPWSGFNYPLLLNSNHSLWTLFNN